MTPEQQVRDLQTDTTAFGATDVKAMENRIIALDMLYKFAGRDNSVLINYNGLNI